MHFSKWILFSVLCIGLGNLAHASQNNAENADSAIRQCPQGQPLSCELGANKSPYCQCKDEKNFEVPKDAVGIRLIENGSSRIIAEIIVQKEELEAFAKKMQKRTHSPEMVYSYLPNSCKSYAESSLIIQKLSKKAKALRQEAAALHQSKDAADQKKAEQNELDAAGLEDMAAFNLEKIGKYAKLCGAALDKLREENSRRTPHVPNPDISLPASYKKPKESIKAE